MSNKENENTSKLIESVKYSINNRAEFCFYYLDENEFNLKYTVYINKAFCLTSVVFFVYLKVNCVRNKLSKTPLSILSLNLLFYNEEIVPCMQNTQKYSFFKWII